MRINHMFVSAVDVDASTRFYCDFLNFSPTRKFNDGAGDSQIVHRDTQGQDFDLLIVPVNAPRLQHAVHIAFEVDSTTEFEDLIEKAKAMVLKPRSQVPLDSEAGFSTFMMYGKTYRHFYVLDPSWVNVEIMNRIS